MEKILIKGPDGTTQIHVDGANYDARAEDSLFEVPGTVLSKLEPHGFALYVAPVDLKKRKAAPTPPKE